MPFYSKLTVQLQPLPINELSVHTSPDSDKVLVIEHKNTSIKLQASTSQQCVEWVRRLHEARSRFERSAVPNM